MENLKAYKYYFLPAIIFLAILFTGLVFLRPNMVKVVQIQQRIAGERNILVQLTGKLSQLEALDESNLISKTEMLLKIVPPEKDVPAILASLKNLSSISNLDLKSVQLDPGDLTTDYPILVSLKLEGEAEGLKKFLEKIELISPLMRPKTITTIYQEGNVSEMSLVLETFFLQFPETLGEIDSPLPEISSEEEKAYQRVSSFEVYSSEIETSILPSGKENPFSF